MTRDLFPVSAKIAIYNSNRTKVLLTEYLPGRYGLPGGHLDDGETPTGALIRELREELSLTLSPNDVTRRDFWLHTGGKIILGFTAVLPENTPIVIDPIEIHQVQWTLISDLVDGTVQVGDYTAFIIANQ